MARLAGSKLISTHLMYHENSQRQAKHGAFDRLADAASRRLRPQAFTHGLGDVARAGHAARAGGGVNTRQQGLIHRQVHADDPAEHLHRDQDMRHGDTMTLVPVNVG